MYREWNEMNECVVYGIRVQFKYMQNSKQSTTNIAFSSDLFSLRSYVRMDLNI